MPLATDLASVAQSFDNAGGIEDVMRFIYYYTGAVNGEDALGHYIRALVEISTCVVRSSVQTPGCGATFGTTTLGSAAEARATATTPTPIAAALTPRWTLTFPGASSRHTSSDSARPAGSQTGSTSQTPAATAGSSTTSGTATAPATSTGTATAPAHDVGHWIHADNAGLNHELDHHRAGAVPAAG